VAYFSQRNMELTVAVPGVYLVTLSHEGRTGYYINPGVRGTSFSAPYVAALAAAAKAVDPTITAAQFIDLLRQSSVHPGTATFSDMYGYGVVDINRFLALMPGVTWFNDISGHWARTSILYAADQNLFGGVGNGAFAPNQTMSRAMFVTVLGRLYREMGGNVPARDDNFVDTGSNTWYSSYVAWAAAQGIVTGLPGDYFGPNQPVTREQAAVFLARFATHIEQNVQGNPARLNNFTDGNNVGDWAQSAMAWAVEEGILTGVQTPQGMALQPANNSTRAQVAVILQRFIDNVGILEFAA